MVLLQLTLETGEIGRQANGAVMVKSGDTVSEHSLASEELSELSRAPMDPELGTSGAQSLLYKARKYISKFWVTLRSPTAGTSIAETPLALESGLRLQPLVLGPLSLGMSPL